MSDKVYFGNGKEVNFQDGSSLIKVSFNTDDLNNMLNNRNDSGWINVNVQKRKTPSQYGHTHSIVLDTWKPKQTQQTNTPQPSQQQNWTPPADTPQDMPF